MDPRITTVDLKLAGMQSVIDHDHEFGPQLKGLWKRLAARSDSIPDKMDPMKAIGYWQFIDNSTRVYFAGIQMLALDNAKWDHPYGLALWNPGPTLFAVFPEKNGNEGTTTGYAFNKINEMGYTFDYRYLGDFEACPLEWTTIDERPKDGYHEIWIPVIAKKGHTQSV